MNAKELTPVEKVVQEIEYALNITISDNDKEEWLSMEEQYADHKTEELQKEVERLKEMCLEEIKIREEVIKENHQLKQENKELVELLEVCKYDLEQMQPYSEWYSARGTVFKIEKLTKTNKDDTSK